MDPNTKSIQDPPKESYFGPKYSFKNVHLVIVVVKMVDAALAMNTVLKVVNLNLVNNFKPKFNTNIKNYHFRAFIFLGIE